MTIKRFFLIAINEFKIIFKCMSGFTTANGKFIMPLKEKLSYDDSSNRCESEGFSICCDLFWNLFWFEISVWLCHHDMNPLKDWDFKFILLKTRTNNKSWILSLHSPQTGSEFIFKMMKLTATMNIGVSLESKVLSQE